MLAALDYPELKSALLARSEDEAPLLLQARYLVITPRGAAAAAGTLPSYHP